MTVVLLELPAGLTNFKLWLMIKGYAQSQVISCLSNNQKTKYRKRWNDQCSKIFFFLDYDVVVCRFRHRTRVLSVAFCGRSSTDSAFRQNSWRSFHLPRKLSYQDFAGEYFAPTSDKLQVENYTRVDTFIFIFKSSPAWEYLTLL